jgi:hypothetical protein
LGLRPKPHTEIYKYKLIVIGEIK